MSKNERKPSVTIVVPCLNEEGNIRGAVDCIYKALGETGRFSSFEILIFNDGSTDKTGAVADALKNEVPGIRVIHNLKNMGFGYNYAEGVRQAKKEYVIMVPGDNEIPVEAIKRVFIKTGLSDIVVPYTANSRVRPLSRRFVSRAFVILINLLFGLNLRYYNGTCAIKSSLLKRLPLKTWGFAYMASILVRLIRSGASYTETGIDIKPRETGKSKAFSPRNIVSVVTAVVSLFWEVRVTERNRYKSKLKRIEAV